MCCTGTVTAVVLWWGEIVFVLDRFPKLKGPALAAVIPAFFAVCLAVAFGSLSVAVAAVGLSRRLLLPGMAAAPEWLIWAVLGLSLMLSAAVAVGLRSWLEHGRGKCRKHPVQ